MARKKDRETSADIEVKKPAISEPDSVPAPAPAKEASIPSRVLFKVGRLLWARQWAADRGFDEASWDALPEGTREDLVQQAKAFLTGGD